MKALVISIVIGLVLSVGVLGANAFLDGGAETNIEFVGELTMGVNLYEYRGRSGWCGLLVGQLHCKTVAIDCESY